MYDGTNKYSFCGSSPEPLFDQLLQIKYRGYIVYAHNLSGFDINYLFKYIASLKLNKGYIVKTTIKDRKLTAIEISYKDI